MLSDCVTVIVPPARRTVSDTPPGMASAADSVGGSPIARTMYGAVSARAVEDDLARGIPVNAESTPIRTSLTWKASAPALRSSWIASSSTSGGTVPSGSAITMPDPGPVGGDGAGEDAQRVRLPFRLGQRLRRRGAAAAQPGQGGLQVGDLRGQFVLAMLQAVEQLHQVVGAGG